MAKYIDVDKMIAEIERRKNESRELAQEHKNSSLGNAAQTMANEDEEILSIIDTLQQEQPEEARYNTLTGQYGEILETHAIWECIAAVGAKLSKDGNMYCFLLGDNIQEGVCGFGKTIFEAALDFYTNIKTEEARKEE